MRAILAAVGVGVVVLSSCGGIDEYNYGYPQAYHEMPKEFEKVEVGGTSYWTHGGRYYQNEPGRGYLLVKPPRGHEQVVAAGAAAPPAPTGTAAPPSGSAEVAESSSGLKGLFTPGGGKAKKGPKTRTVGRSPSKRRRLGGD